MPKRNKIGCSVSRLMTCAVGTSRPGAGQGVSELVLKGLRSDLPAARRGGFPVFAAGDKPNTLDDIRHAEDEA